MSELQIDKQAVNQAIAQLVRTSIGTDCFELWFPHSQCIQHLDLDGKPVVRVEADTEFSIRRIQQTFSKDLRTAVDRACGPQVKIDYRVGEACSSSTDEEGPVAGGVAGGTEPKPTETTTTCSDTVQQSIPFGWSTPNEPGSRPIRRRVPTLESFCFSPEDRLLQAAVSQLVEAPGQYSPVFLYGPTGSGKTHLLEAIIETCRRRLRMKRCIFVSAEQFTTQFVSSLQHGTGMPMFRRKFRDLDLLAIDDIQFLAGKKATLAEFHHTLDNLVRLGKQVVLSADRSPLELGHLGADICARLSAGLSCSVRYPDFEGRLRIAKSLCAQRKFTLPMPVLRLICDRLPRDVRRLAGAINRLHAYWVTFNGTIDVEFAHQVLGDLFSMSGPKCTSMVSIEQAVCEFCGVQPGELKSSSRQKRISAARMLAMYLSREYTGSAFSEIGDYFGGRSHSTVIAAQRKVAKWIQEDSGISLPHAQYSAKEAVRRLESNLRIS